VIVVIDNYDSFTYNLVQYLGELGAEVRVYRNDAIAIADLRRLQPEGIVISPGPGRPDSAGVSLEVIRELAPTVPILGVCLGHQCLGQVYGGSVVAASTLVHGKTSPIFHEGTGVFADLTVPFDATRYHSLVVARADLPAILEVTAWLADGTIMGLRHREYPHLQGVQFHPESILTGSGKQLLRNFLSSLKTPVPSPTVGR